MKGKVKHRPETLCSCGHQFRLHGPTCGAWIHGEKDSRGARRVGRFCNCVEFRLRKKAA